MAALLGLPATEPIGAEDVQEALADAGVEPKTMGREELRKIGVMLGSSGGSQEFTEDFAGLGVSLFDRWLPVSCRFTIHSPPPGHSSRRAAMGSRRAARRAGR